MHVWVAGRRFWLDFAVEAVQLAIEVDGVSAHSDPAAFHRDRERQNLLIRAGWTVLRYTPHQLQRDMPAVIAEIRPLSPPWADKARRRALSAQHESVRRGRR